MVVELPNVLPPMRPSNTTLTWYQVQTLPYESQRASDPTKPCGGPDSQRITQGEHESMHSARIAHAKEG